MICLPILTVIFDLTLFIALFHAGVILLVLTPINLLKKTDRRNDAPNLRVSVVVAAYNEESSIRSCVDALFASRYPIKEVIIVNDGSTDSTARAVAQMTLDYPERLQSLNLEHVGKAKALNAGIAQAKGDIIIVTDADMICDQESIGRLASYFHNRDVGGVSGNKRISNLSNLVALAQEIEYITGANLSRHFYSTFAGMVNIPGNIGAFRRTAIEQVGGYSQDTVTEDTDITLSICEQGWRAYYDPRAIAWTKANESITEIIPQHRRWLSGILQVVWKHRYSILATRNFRLKFLCLPYHITFRLLMPCIFPMTDWYAITSMITGDTSSITLYAFLHLVTLIVAFVALQLDGADKRMLIYFPVIQFAQRQYTIFLTFKAMIDWLKRVPIKW